LLIANPADIERTIALLLPAGGVAELRILLKTGDRPLSGYFNDAAALKREVQRHSAANILGVYFTLNPVDPALLGRCANRVQPAQKDALTKDHNILRRQWLLLDFDPVRVSGVSSTEDEHAAAILRAETAEMCLMTEDGWPEPIWADSGNGGHNLYLIDLPNDDASEKLIKGVLQVLAKRFDNAVVKLDQTVYNASRISKLYGTVVRKGDNGFRLIPARPHRLSRILEIPPKLEIVPRELLEKMAATAETPKARISIPAATGRSGSFDLEQFLRQYLPNAHDPVPNEGGRKWVLPECPFNPYHRDSAVFEAADGKFGFKCFHNSCKGKDWHAVRELYEGPRQQPNRPPEPPWPPQEGPPHAPPPLDAPPAKPEAKRRDDAAFTFTSLGDLLNEPEEETPWLLDGILPTAGTSILIAKPKDGKSTLARCLAVAVASGEEFFGRATTQGTVLYIALEEKRGEVRKHFRLLGVTGEEPIHVHIDSAPVSAMQAAQRAIALYKPVLVIIDPLQKFTRVKDTNDYAQVTAALEPVLLLARKSGAHLLCVYHAGKTEKANPVDAALGSIGFSGGVDTIVVCRRGERCRTIQTTQRYGEDMPETVIEWDAERRAVSLGAERAKAESAKMGVEILELLKTRSEPPTEADIREAVEGRATLKSVALRDLLKEGKVNRSGSGKKGGPFRYSLASAEVEEEL
jgi:hypothetical protein